MKAQNTINLGQISGEMKTWNTFILGSKGLILHLQLTNVLQTYEISSPADKYVTSLLTYDRLRSNQ